MGFPALIRGVGDFKRKCVSPIKKQKRADSAIRPSALSFASLSFAWGIVRIIPGSMVCRINHMLNFRENLLNHRFNAVFERNIRHTTTLAAPTHVNVDGVFLDVQEFYLSTVCSDGGVNAFVNEFLNLLCLGIIPCWRIGVFNVKPT